ncbi:MAG: hypothetical protein WAO19_12360 [Candidatus Kryptoniota bacterium]
MRLRFDVQVRAKLCIQLNRKENQLNAVNGRRKSNSPARLEVCHFEVTALFGRDSQEIGGSVAASACCLYFTFYLDG